MNKGEKYGFKTDDNVFISFVFLRLYCHAGERVGSKWRYSGCGGKHICKQRAEIG